MPTTSRAFAPRRATTRLAVPVVALLALLTGCSAVGVTGDGDTAPAASVDAIFPDDEIGPLVEALPQQTIKPLPSARLAEGLVPPTNRWFSGLVFGDDSMPVFPSPLSFQLTDGGFDLGLPRVTTAPKVIMGGHVAHIGVSVGADVAEVSDYDTASVTITHLADDVAVGETVIARGSPFVSFTALSAADVSTVTAFTPSSVDGAATAVIDGTTYGLVSDAELSSDGTGLALAEGETATWFALADGAELADFADAATHTVTGTTLDYTTSDTEVSTTIAYTTADGEPTIVAALPHQQAGLADSVACSSATYSTIYGDMTACTTDALTWSSPALEPSGALDLSALDDADRDRLAEQVTLDIAETETFADDTYFGGKSLYRAVNLLEIAEEVGADDAAATMRDRLVTTMSEWMDPDRCDERDLRCFVYDPEARGIVGLATSFGSEEFNDHHFHYGYFLYTAGVLAADDPELVESWAPVMNLLAADLATRGESTYFPEQRNFDSYGGHSWASGTSPFGDGNNQESSSEAVTAWNGLALWAAASDQGDLETEARWMLAAEATSAKAYWTDFPLDDPIMEGFEHTITSLVWGGKRDYATWFSAEPSAMLGILVLPMSPVADYLAGDPERIDANIADAAPDGFDVTFGDYLLMYSALSSTEAASRALEESRELHEDRIDDGNSRSYMLAWLMAHAAA
ncbi:glycosyl hydrolase [Marisediminicola sp. LYQ85]|uniref:glycosyl hydrolase n=1 Tax=Marisediminicola sp. LYQ85 TaxID=3391062 RepID=UPI0039839334